MEPAKHTTIIPLILAGGAGRRLGGPKALARLRGESLLSHVLRLYEVSGLGQAILVTGAESRRVQAEASAHSDLRIVHNPHWESGMLGSVLVGLAAAQERGADAILLHPVDHPLVSVVTVRSVAAALAAGALIAVPSFRGRRGHPGGFSRAVFAELVLADERLGARALLLTDPSRVQQVETSSDCILGANTPEDLAFLETVQL